jgi:hypothetical protein
MYHRERQRGTSCPMTWKQAHIKMTRKPGAAARRTLGYLGCWLNYFRSILISELLKYRRSACVEAWLK